MEKNIDVLQNWLKDQGAEVAFLTDPENIAYFSGYHSEPHERVLGLAVFPESEPFLFTPALEVEDVRGGDWTHPAYGYNDTENPFIIIADEIKKRVANPTKFAIEKKHMSVDRFEQLSGLFSGCSFIPIEHKIEQVRLIKTEAELKILKEAALLADYAVQVGVDEIAEGKTEAEIVAKIEYEMKKKGVTAMSFDTMVLTGKNGALPHGTPGETKIKKGDLVLFDLGVVHKGYCSDITRTVAFGDISDEQKKIYDTVLEAQVTAVKKVKAGVKASEIDLTARNIIREAGYGDYFPHRLGHGLGASVHEFPSITETNNMELQENMVFTIEPGIYVPGVAGVRIEDDLVVTKDGVQVLTEFPKTLQVIK
ncbi:M24 family metallopeptidase [Listeria welshimeri]|uniref:M24 family metallopeptidase n=1 Tax=Listeria welshimeri TaxID=1643 RepID=UPI0018892A2B|nr:Xaa-Pro peptidase family protein [Listeria welshimeri]MBF2483809.1 aminopeptidase P family protein [Listeria welshimeri]MBF2635100.1 aminopeptidase P family protein [Listeria welshimeri]